jgi:hypothetical protein
MAEPHVRPSPSMTVMLANSPSVLTSFGATNGTPLRFVSVQESSTGCPNETVSVAQVTRSSSSDASKR